MSDGVRCSGAGVPVDPQEVMLPNEVYQFVYGINWLAQVGIWLFRGAMVAYVAEKRREFARLRIRYWEVDGDTLTIQAVSDPPPATSGTITAAVPIMLLYIVAGALGTSAVLWFLSMNLREIRLMNPAKVAENTTPIVGWAVIGVLGVLFLNGGGFGRVKAAD